MREWEVRDRKKKELDHTKEGIVRSIKAAKRGQKKSAKEELSEKERFMAGYWHGRLEVLGQNLQDVLTELEEYQDLED